MSLYKYVIPERTDILINKVIRFSQPSVLNDPFEMKPYFQGIAKESFIREQLTYRNLPESVIKEAYESEVPETLKDILPFESAKKLLDQNPQKMEQLMSAAVDEILNVMGGLMPNVREQFFQSLNSAIGILCLSEKPDNHLMWSHYAQNHQGFVIEFDEAHPYFHQQRTAEDEFGYLRKVEYKDERPDYEGLTDMTGTDVFLAKGKEWEYEQEWRMLRPLRDANRIIENPAGNIHLFSIEPESITGVILGYQITQDKKDEIAKILSTNECYSQVKKYQAFIKERGYGLDIIKSDN